MKFLEGLKGKLKDTKDMVVSAGTGEPVAVSSVSGFIVSIEKKEGVLLTSRPKNQPDADPKPASEPYYYELRVNVTGDNPEYPREDRAYVARFTEAAKGDSSWGLCGSACFIPSGARFTGFIVEESFDDGQFTMGRRMPPHHGVMLKAKFKEADGNKTSVSVGPGWVRKSERETLEWEAAADSKTFYI